MENETTALKWIFYREVDVPRDIEEILVTGEVADRAFKTVRDVAVFTNKRLIVKDVQGLTGTKVEMYSLPYSSVNMWSTENAGILDFSSEVELWTRAGHIKIELKRGIDIREFERLLAEYIL
ncbi:PH domain-containing protein [uncultured Granulicatella sp.]|uniref:PH domain-containing protein n=1 Tax=uncultured Granulicatella sp. TaxID=316089 RepID=UPI0028D630C5|nr:PH domain-containing protein [uncultured Granulicatella sp.]